MKIIHILLSLILLSFNITLFAGSDSCYIDPTETRPASEFLSDCGSNTTGIDPSQFSPDMEGTKDQVIKIANGAISFGALLAV